MVLRRGFVVKRAQPNVYTQTALLEGGQTTQPALRQSGVALGANLSARSSIVTWRRTAAAASSWWWPTG